MPTRIKAALCVAALLAATLVPTAPAPALQPSAPGTARSAAAGPASAIHLAHRARSAFARADAALREADALSGRVDWAGVRAGFAAASAEFLDAAVALAERASNAAARDTAARLVASYTRWRDDAQARLGATAVTALPLPRRIETGAAAIRADLDALLLLTLSETTPAGE